MKGNHMTGEEFKAIRDKLGLSVLQMGRTLGYEGNANTVSVQVRKFEGGTRDIPPWIGRLVFMYGKHGVPDEFLK